MTTSAQATAGSVTPFVKGLRCQECGAIRPAAPLHVCEACFGPLEVAYDGQAIGRVISRKLIESRPPTMWRYAEWLPLQGPPVVGLHTGMTPLVKADRLARALGIRELWIKNDAVSHPSLSFKDRVVAVAIAKAREFGLSVLGCASTGNLANALAAQAASLNMPAVVLIPADLEPAKITATTIYGAAVVRVKGTYDEVNRLCSEIADKYRWGFVNVNLRPYYTEGAKTVGYEIAEQLGWRVPAHLVCPLAGGSLIVKIAQAFTDFRELDLVTGAPTRFHGAQPAGCGPIASMVRDGRATVRPIRQPHTLVKALAVGDPADAHLASTTIVRSGGFAALPDDDDSIAGVRLLARTEGIFAELAGGTTVAATHALIDEGKIGRDDGPVVICITGQGLKTQDHLLAHLPTPAVIGTRLSDFDTLWSGPFGGMAVANQ